jgi:hypothetical protein
VTCDMWVQALAALPSAPATWDDGVDGALLCHLLFSVHDDPAEGAAMLHFRCVPCTDSTAPRPTTVPQAQHAPLCRGLRDVALNV